MAHDTRRRAPRSRPALRRSTRWRTAAIGLAVLLLLVLAVSFSSHRTQPVPPYNVVLISLDTVRQDVLGCYGRRPRHAPTISPSPALDQLAREGVRMVDGYAPTSWTLPSHLSLMAGQPPLVHGVETEVGTLDPASPTLAEILKHHGYRTVGIYSAPYLEPHWGFARGFDHYEAAYAPPTVAASQHAAAIRADVEKAAAAGAWTQYDDLKRQQVAIEKELNESSQDAVTSDQITAAVTAQIDALTREGHPWFVFAHFFDAHCDYVPPPPYDTRFDPDYTGSATGKGCLTGAWVGRPDPDRPGGFLRALSDRDLDHVLALYEGEVGWVDSHVATILRSLDALGVAQKTLVIVVSDHGEEFFEHGNIGHRHNLHEEVTRVPMILRLPGVLPAGAAVRGAVSLTDVLPTVLDILGLPHAATPGAESFLALIRGTANAASRTILSRLVIMFAGDVEVDAAQHILLREIMVQDVFRQGPIKIMRTRSWPQFPTGLAADLNATLSAEAAKQYEREELKWIDVEHFPAEPDEQLSTRFTDPAARAVLDAFRRQYEALLRLRRHQVSPLPENMRHELERLGYGDATSSATFPEPDIVLPPPRDG